MIVWLSVFSAILGALRDKSKLLFTLKIYVQKEKLQKQNKFLCGFINKPH